MFWSVGRSCLDHKSFWANEEVSKCATIMVGGGGPGPQQSLIRQVFTRTLCWAGLKMNGREVAKSSNCHFVCSRAPLAQHLHDINVTFHPNRSHNLCLFALLIFIKGFPRVNYRIFSSIVDTLVHLGTPGMLIGSFRCWSNRLSHKDLQQSNFCQVDHSSY